MILLFFYYFVLISCSAVVFDAFSSSLSSSSYCTNGLLQCPRVSLACGSSSMTERPLRVMQRAQITFQCVVLQWS